MSFRAEKQVITAHTEAQTDKQRQYPKDKTGLG